MPAAGPCFDAPLSAGGYRWWYLDALSDDGRHGLCVIFFIGSVFSPYYAHARARATARGTAADPWNFCAVNVALTGATQRWCMTERPRHRVRAGASALQIGRSTLQRCDGGYRLDLQERGSRLPWPVRGSVHLQPTLQPGVAFSLDGAGHHHWEPIAPRARVRVELLEPRQSWCGEAYFDSNHGDRALEQDFTGWQWSRSAIPTGSIVFYETQHRTEPASTLALRFAADGVAALEPLPRPARLAASGWGIQRQARSEDASVTHVLRTLLDAPFYARSLLSARLDGYPVVSVHESLNLERFSRRWVRCLLPFRMPRFAGAQRAGADSHAAC
jgi:carotenoid 1,2-hydratase